MESLFRHHSTKLNFNQSKNNSKPFETSNDSIHTCMLIVLKIEESMRGS